MTKHDVGILKQGDRVRVKGRDGVVSSPHEPEWIEHRTLAFRKELQGADIRFDGEHGSTYSHAADIELVTPNNAVRGAAGAAHPGGAGWAGGEVVKPCGFCKHIEDGGGDAACLNCKHNAPDKFEPDGKCATCQHDPRLHGVCARCVDYDKHTPNKGVTGAGGVP